MKNNNRQQQHRGGPPMAAMMGNVPQKAKDFKGTLTRLIKYLKPQIPILIVVFSMAILSTVLMILAPKILGNMTNLLQEGIMKGALDMDAITKVIISVISIYVGSSIFSFVANFVSAGLSQKVVFKLRQDIKDKLDRLPIKFFDTNQTGDILSRITNDVELVSTSLQQSLTQLITSIVSLVGTIVMMLTISGWMTLVSLGTLPLFFLIIAIIIKKSQKKFVKQQETLGEINGYIEEVFGAKKIIKLFGKEKESEVTFDKLNETLAKEATDAQFLSGTVMPFFNCVNYFGYAALCVLGGFLAGRPINPMMIGDIQAFLQYFSQFGQPIMQTAGIANTLQSTVAAAERIFQLLDEEEEPSDSENCVSVADVTPKVSFESVFFSYVKDKELIKNFSLDVNEGSKIAIVGATGAGKTTIVNLLLRFYEIDGGRITIDGIDIRDFTKPDLRSLIGMVLQETWLECGTIFENIAYGDSCPNKEKVIEAAQKAYIHDYIVSLKDGYDTVLNEEVSNISNGQKQLLTIARAIYADNKILILDEATSSVDTRTESYIQNAMTAMMVGRTSFVIAHRLSTIRSSNLIIVMDKGTIAEKGTHEELMKISGGVYRKLYDSQF